MLCELKGETRRKNLLLSAATLMKSLDMSSQPEISPEEKRKTLESSVCKSQER